MNKSLNDFLDLDAGDLTADLRPQTAVTLSPGDHPTAAVIGSGAFCQDYGPHGNASALNSSAHELESRQCAPFDDAGDSKLETGLSYPDRASSAPVVSDPRETLSSAVPHPDAAHAEALPAEAASSNSRSSHASCPPAISSLVTRHSSLVTSNSDTRAREQHATEDDHRAAEAEAALYREFLQLTTEAGHSLRSAAKLLGKSASQFSGENSRFTRFLRLGVAGLLPEPRHAGAKLAGLSAQIEALGWFVPAAKFFNLKCNSAADRGSVPEAIRRTISLPALPTGWTNGLKTQLLKTINAALTSDLRPLTSVPACPPELRAAILARERAGQPLVPERVARQIIIPKNVVKFSRNPRNWELSSLNAPGSARRFNSQGSAGATRSRMQIGDWFGGDDGTPGIAVCVPCDEVMTPTTQKYKVLLGRFQWLPFVDCAYDFALGFDYVVRPRGSYRAEDILHGMKTVVKTHGVPHQGFQFEGGTFNSHLVQNAIKALGCQHWRTYSPHQKIVEILFNKAWNRLAVNFPHADMGRFRGENQENCSLYESCKAGHADPRRYFPSLAIVIQVFEEVLAEHNRTPIKSANYGSWIPEEIWAQQTAERPLRPISAGSEWLFAPFAFERTVRGMIVGGKVPMFEDFSVPFEFNAPWLHEYDGAKVRCHFDPRDPNCTATLVLCEAFNHRAAGTVLGPARLINETTGYLRMAMGWAEDDTQSGRVARQKNAAWMRRVSRGLGVGGKIHYATDEQRDGLGSVVKIERSDVAQASLPAGSPSIPARRSDPPTSDLRPLTSEEERNCDSQRAARRAANLASIEQFEQRHKHLLV
jgi:hypothetical protein